MKFATPADVGTGITSCLAARWPSTAPAPEDTVVTVDTAAAGTLSTDER